MMHSSEHQDYYISQIKSARLVVTLAKPRYLLADLRPLFLGTHSPIIEKCLSIFFSRLNMRKNGEIFDDAGHKILYA